ncbi:MAG: hypothetical protein H0U89_01815, partial [Acidimicrobiia bacterium]|nr:hypothetical protein [Acidimicrobiia bacterium]
MSSHYCVVRVWLPDRPGALGQVASRIGAVRGDVVGIEIVERDGGQAIDELVVGLADEALVELLVREVRAVDGVAVEDVRTVAEPLLDPRLAALDAAVALVAARSKEELTGALLDRVSSDLGADWVALVDGDADLRGAVGSPPSPAWLLAFLQAARSVEAGCCEPEEVAWAPLGDAAV